MASTIGRKLAEFASKLSLPIPVSLGGTGSTNGFPQPNLLINSLFNYNGRGFAGGALVAGAYGYDRWGAYTGGANYTVAAGGVITIVSGTICQPIESPGLGGKTVTVSVENPTAAVTVTLGTSGNNAVGVIPLGSGRKSVTMVVPGGLTNDLQVRFSGPTSFSKPKLEIGSVATEFVNIPVQIEWYQIQRYYQNWDSRFVLTADTATANINIKTIPRMASPPTVTFTVAGGTGASPVAYGQDAIAQSGIHSAVWNCPVLRLSAELVCTN